MDVVNHRDECCDFMRQGLQALLFQVATTTTVSSISTVSTASTAAIASSASTASTASAVFPTLGFRSAHCLILPLKAGEAHGHGREAGEGSGREAGERYTTALPDHVDRYMLAPRTDHTASV